MGHTREQQANKHVLHENPLGDKEARQRLLGLKLVATKWEQNLFDQPWLPVAMLIPIVGLFLIGLAEDIYYYFEYFMERGISFQLFASYFSLDAIYVSFALLTTLIVWRFQHFAKQTPRALCKLWENGMVSPKTVAGDKDTTWTLLDFLTRYEAALANEKRYLLIGPALLIVTVVLANYIMGFGLSFKTFPDVTSTLFSVFKWVIFPNLWLWICFLAGWSMLVTAYFIRRLSQEFNLRVISSHPDRCEGLKPIGDLCLQLAGIALIASLVLAYWGSVGRAFRAAGVLPKLSDEKVAEVVEKFLPERLEEFRYLFDPTREPQPITQALSNVGTVVAIIGGGWLFLYPLLGIHERMKHKKAELAQTLAEATLELDIELERFTRTKDETQIKDKLGTVQNLNSLLQGCSVWPISRRSFILGFATPEFLGIVGLILNINVETADNILKFLLGLMNR